MIKTFKRQWFNEYYAITFDDEIWNLDKDIREKMFWEEYNNHNFRKNEKYDKYLDKMLFKYDLKSEDYHKLCRNFAIEAFS